MAWFRGDDKLHGHPKARKATLAPMGLWVMSGTYSADYGLDGRVPAEYVTSWPGGKRLAEKLVESKLWHPLPYTGPCTCILPTVDQSEGGWCFHDWNDCNPSAAELEAAKAADAIAQEIAKNADLRAAVKARDEGKCRYCKVEVRWTDRRSSVGGTYNLIDPAGGTSMDNVVVCCRGCAEKKSGLTPEKAGMTLLPEPGRLF